jgi:RNA polymerase sigma-70 factor (ECF subfamily)
MDLGHAEAEFREWLKLLGITGTDRPEDTDPRLLEAAKQQLIARPTDIAPWMARMDALSEVYQTYSALVLRIILSHRTPREDVADCFMSVWGDILFSLLKFNYDRQRGQFRGWLTTLTLRSLAKRRLRHKRLALAHLSPEEEEALVDLQQDAPGQFDEATKREQLQIACEALRCQVPEMDYKALYGHDIEGKSFNEIGQEMRTTANSARKARDRAMHVLRRLLR